MNFRFDENMEAWAQNYKRIAHDPTDEKKHRFFRCDDEMRLNEFLQRFQQSTGNMCCGFVDMIEGSANVPKRIEEPILKFLFMKQVGDSNKPGFFKTKSDVIHEIKYHAWKYLDYLNKLIREASKTRKTTNEHPLAYAGDVMENVSFDMIGPITNEWYCLIVTLRPLISEPSCYTESDYFTPNFPA